MTSPTIWIVFPIICSLFIWFIPARRTTIFVGLGVVVALILSAWLIPIDTLLTLPGITITVSSKLTILGRQLVISPNEQPLIIFIYLSLAFWFICVLVTNASEKFIPYGLLITSLLVSSLVVKPFLYASLLIQIAALISILLLRHSSNSTGRGILRFLSFQTFTMPFFLFSGWLLTGITASPEEITLTTQASIFLGLGFVFLLGIFPFHTWIPIISEEVHPLASAFILWIFPTTGLIFGCFFLDSYSWIRDSSQLELILRSAGMIMVISGGLWAAFQKNLKRMFAYAMVMETGYSLLALSFRESLGMDLFYSFLFPRTITLLLWTSALSILLEKAASANFVDVQSMSKQYPFSTTLIIISHLSFTGIPLLAGFPNHMLLWDQLGSVSITIAFWYLIATIGLLTGGIRTLVVLLMPTEQVGIKTEEKLYQKVFISTGIGFLVILGLFPRIIDPLVSQLPLMFTHLGR